MEILKPNNGKEIQYIVNSNLFVKVWDYGKKCILIHLKMPSPERKIWTWINTKAGSIVDISEESYDSFDEAINKAVNNPYCTVYSFKTYDDMAMDWEEIKYVETITTTYMGNKNV